MPAEIRAGGFVRDTEAFAIITEGWNDMVQEGWTPDRQAHPPFSATDEVLYAQSGEGDLVGVLVWANHPDRYEVTLAYVEPSSRRRGIFTQMLNCLRQRAAQTKLPVCITPHNANTTALIVINRMKATSYSITYDMMGGGLER